MQHSANHLRAYPEIHARVPGRVSGVRQAPSFKRRTLAAWGHLPTACQALRPFWPDTRRGLPKTN